MELEIFHSLQFDFKLYMDRLNPSPFENVLIFVNHQYYEYEQKADEVDETETKDSWFKKYSLIFFSYLLGNYNFSLFDLILFYWFQ